MAKTSSSNNRSTNTPKKSKPRKKPAENKKPDGSPDAEPDWKALEAAGLVFDKKLIPENRSIVYTKDLQNLTGKSERSARRMMQHIREKARKTNGELITVKDVCEVMGIDEATLQAYLV